MRGPMADAFDYTYKSWDKIRPKLLKSTGLGDALKKYEAKKAALKSARALSDLVKLQGEAVAALDAVEAARGAAIKACGAMFADCKATLQRADAARERARATGYALTKLNETIVAAAAELKNDRKKLDDRLKLAQDRLKAVMAIKAKDDKNEKTLEQLKRIYAGEGDDMSLVPEGMINDMIMNRSKLAKSFPTVSADLEKMKKSFDEARDTNAAYSKAKSEIRAKLRELKVI